MNDVSMARINKNKNESNPENTSALGVIGKSFMNGADLFSAKIDDIGSLATGLTLLPYEWLSGNKGEVTKYLEEHESYKKELQKRIKKRREEIDVYADNNIIVGVPLKVASSFIEQTVDPLQMGLNVSTQGFYMNALQNTLDYIYEEHLINDRKLSDFNSGDFANIGTGIAMAGITSKFQVDDISKPLYKETFIPPLDKMAKENAEKGKRTINREAVANIIKRKESGQTLSLPKGYNNSETISKTIDNGIIPKLKEISKIIENEDLTTKYAIGEKTNGDVKIKPEIARTMKPLYTEISLGRKQALGEIADELGAWAIKNNKYDGITPVGDYIDVVMKEIEPDELVRLFQGKSKDPKYKDLQPILNKYINEFVGIKAKKDISYKKDGFYINTLYNKQKTMVFMQKALENENETNAFIKGQLKDIGSKVYLNDIEASKVNLKGKGYYSINENPKELLKALYYDINSTTKSVKISNIKGDIGLKEKSIYDVALKWVDIKNKKSYFNILKKIKNAKIDMKEWGIKKFDLEEILTPDEIEFKKKFDNEMLMKFENIFKGYEEDKDSLFRNIISTIANERSGYNKAIEKFENFTTAYNYNNEVTSNIEWLDFKIPAEVKRKLKNEIDGLHSLSAFNVIKSKNYADLSFDDKSIKGMKDFTSWKLLFGLRHLREASPNTAIVNSGAYRLGFDDRMGFVKGQFEMYKVHYDLLKNYDTLISKDLSSIKDPIERMNTELFIRKLAENGYNYDKWGIGKGLDKLALIGGAGQSVSDVHRIGMALRFTSKAMFEEFSKMI